MLPHSEAKSLTSDIGDRFDLTPATYSITSDLELLANIRTAAGLLSETDTPAELRPDLVELIYRECDRLSISIMGFLQERYPESPRFLD